MTIKFVLPVMRPKSALLVLQDLAAQTQLIDKITIVDNGGDFILQGRYPFKIDVLTPKKNIGTNQVWNFAFDFDADFIGFLGDDFRLDKNLIKILVKSFDHFPDAGMTTSTIFSEDIFLNFSPNHIQGRIVSGKGHFGACILKKCVMDQLPLIPKEFKIFFGDDFLGWWINTIGYKIYEVSVGIIHKHKTDLKMKLDYPKIIEEERIIWKQWLRGQISI